MTRPSLATAWDKLSPNVRGSLLVTASGVFFATVNLLVKFLGHDLHVMQIAFFRALFGLLWVVPFVLPHGLAVLKTRRPVGHFLRGAFGMGAMFCLFYSAIHLPLADATALTFTKPYFVVGFAVLFLGEPFRTERLLAITIGFAGMLILMRPGVSTEPAAFVALFGAIFMALVVIMLAKLGQTEPSVTVMFYFGLVSTVMTAIPALVVWQPPSLWQCVMLVAIGAIGASAQTLMLRGFATGETTVLVNFEYIQLIHAAVFGFIFFGDLPDRWTIVGSLIIVGSAAFLVRSEKKNSKPAATAAPTPAPAAARTHG